MTIKPFQFTRPIGAILVASLLVACNTTSEDTTQPMSADVSDSVTVEDGVPGGVQRHTAHMEATVKAIDYDARTVTLEDNDGGTQTITIGPDAVNFNQVEKGDQVSVVYTEETVVYLRELGEVADDGAAGAAGRAPEGQKPQAFAAGATEITAVVMAVDLANHSATLQFPDESIREVPVRPDVELSPDQVGREVVIQTTAAVAISVDTPE